MKNVYRFGFIFLILALAAYGQCDAIQENCYGDLPPPPNPIENMLGAWAYIFFITWHWVWVTF